MRSQSVSSTDAARACSAAIAACSAYGPRLGVRPGSGRERIGAREGVEAAADAPGIPPPSILRVEQDRLAVGSGTGGEPRRLQLHERREAVHLGVVGDERREDAAEPHGLVAERRAHPVVALGRRVALVEEQVHDAEHGREPLGALGAARLLDRGARLGEGALRARDALRDRGLRREVRAGDLARREPGDELQRERRLRLGRERRVAADEHEPQHVVLDVVDAGAGVLVDGLGELVGDRREGGVVPGPAAEGVDRAPLRGGHEPRAGIVGDARGRPLRERRDDRVLREVLGERHVAHDAHERRRSAASTRAARPPRSRRASGRRPRSRDALARAPRASSPLAPAVSSSTRA